MVEKDALVDTTTTTTTAQPYPTKWGDALVEKEINQRLVGKLIYVSHTLIHSILVILVSQFMHNPKKSSSASSSSSIKLSQRNISKGYSL